MLARVTIIEVQPGKMGEVTRIWRDLMEQGAKPQKGFKDGRLLFDPDTSKCISMSLWETEDDLLAFETGDVCKQRLAEVAGFLAARPVAERYEVNAKA